MRLSTFLYLLFVITSSSLFGQNRIGTGAVSELYTSVCASCHGAELTGGLGTSLLNDPAWKYVGKGKSFLEYVKEGNLQMGMPAYEGALTDAQIRSLEIYIDEMRQKSERAKGPLVAEVDGVYSAGGYSFKLETVVDGLSKPWSIAFLPTNGVLITERDGSLRMFKDGELKAPIEGTPKVWANGQGGLLEVAAHPDYQHNAWVYLAFSESGGEQGGKKAGMTKIVRGRIIDNQWMDEEVVFEVPAKFHRSAGVHFGTRLVFKDGFLFFGIGDRGAQDMAQDLSVPNGKIHRIHDDGRVPKDNPFTNEPDAYPSIWTYGNRNPQGLDLHPSTGEIWESEHGPRGGDEINVIQAGRNYGWPVITYGMNYNGKPITGITAKEGMEQPKHYWTPSIAVCGIDFYEGEVFPDWKYNLFAGGLASQELHRLIIEDGQVVKDEIILKDAGRVRDVASGPDGHLYVVLNGPDKVVRLVSAD
ncbi:MAG: PQQ-dependent sugar dehydrogenase [Opitutaceae bacterium]